MRSFSSKFDLSRYSGHVRIANALGDFRESHNDVVDQGATVLAQLLAGKPGYRIAEIYIEFQNTVTPVADPVSPTDTAATRQAVVSPADLIRADLVSAPLVDSSGAPFVNNRDTFYALTTATVGLLHGLPFNAGANSHIVSACLVAAPGGSDYLQDLLYARFVLPSPLPVAGSGQVSAVWTTVFN